MHRTDFPSDRTPPAGGDVVGTDERVRLVHALVQHVAHEVQVDLLHIKGPIVGEQFGRRKRTSVDVDVLVRPAHLNLFVDALSRHGWRVYWKGGGRSLSHHATVLTHEYWRIAIDAHHEFPGFSLSPQTVFEALWRDRSEVRIAGFSCQVPAPTDHALVLALHLLRSPWSGKARADLLAALDLIGTEALASRADELSAAEALSALLPEITGRRTGPVARYWTLRHADAAGVRLWWALILQEPNLRARARRMIGALEPDLPLGQAAWSGPREYLTAAATRWGRGARQLGHLFEVTAKDRHGGGSP